VRKEREKEGGWEGWERGEIPITESVIEDVSKIA